MPTTQDAYLHTITGGYDDAKRKKVRQLFQGESLEEEPPHKVTEYIDLIVGAVEEINAVGVKRFKTNHVRQVLEIFGVLRLFEIQDEGSLDVHIESALAVIGCGRSMDTFNTPNTNLIEALHRQYCSKENEALRAKTLAE